ncbi:MAG: copper-binding protein [Magnetococcales bacterium]|nr:copper-binding protein [Magnetococcales bacterium]NGZ25667.1 copper-binding protein [Magnetococcales bacterium]
MVSFAARLSFALLFCASIAGADNAAPAMAKQAEANGVVNSAMPGRINLTHEAIPLLGWPPMQMDFNMAPHIDATKLRPGLKVRFVVKEVGPTQYQIIAIHPDK